MHQFDQPIEIILTDDGQGSIPASSSDGITWHVIAPLPQGTTTLPSDWQDGYFRASDGVHVLTRHLTTFGLLTDHQAPTPPTGFVGVVGTDGLTLRWAPGTDNSGHIGQFTLYVDGKPYANFETSQFETKLGAFSANDTRQFSIVETDPSGNVSDAAGPLTAVPNVAGLTLADAQTILAARGFSVGTLTQVVSTAPVGTVVSPSGVTLAAVGAPVNLSVSSATVPRSTEFLLNVIGTSRLAPTSKSITVRLTSTQRSPARHRARRC
jgi:hypothetical protein